jgi:transcription elongation factor Elf1
MSLQIDHKFIGLVSPKLQKFKRKRDHLYNFRCPFCGDSKKNQNKCRGFFYKKQNDMFFVCHNCGRGTTLANFLKEMDISLHKEYLFERFKSGKFETSNYKKVDTIQADPVIFFENLSHLESLKTIEELSIKHYARVYIESRLIPKEFYSSLYFCDDFKVLIDSMIPDNDFLLQTNDPRIIIPFKNKKGDLIALQGRALIDNKIRYITIKIKKNAPKIFGLDRLDIDRHIYIVEGPLDSFFIPNCIAAAGSDLPKVEKLKDHTTIIYDNEPRNEIIIRKMDKTIDRGFSICIWPTYMHEKDINDMILSGYSPDNVKQIIDENTDKGLKAKLRLKAWKKV